MKVGHSSLDTACNIHPKNRNKTDVTSFRRWRRNLPIRNFPLARLPGGNGSIKGAQLPNLPEHAKRTTHWNDGTEWANASSSSYALSCWFSINGNCIKTSSRFPLISKLFLQPRANRFARKNSQGGQSSIYSPAPEYDDPANYAPEEDQYRRCNPYGQSGGDSLYCGPEYDDPANCAEEDQYGSQYCGPYNSAPYDHYDSRGSIGRRSVGSIKNQLNGNGSPEPPPPPPPRNHETSNSSFNDSKESNEISEAECDRDNGPRGNYGGDFTR